MQKTRDCVAWFEAQDPTYRRRFYAYANTSLSREAANDRLDWDEEPLSVDASYRLNRILQAPGTKVDFGSR